ncbi:MAG TPA: hypothetical protein VNP03_11570 [Pseudonocardia sp.]|nr:hypothetical protein [Pseudonocardia sp.]
MKRLFWLGLGVATGVIVTRKAAEAAQRLTPAGVGEQVGEGLRELAAAIGSFGAEVRAGMAEREHELTDMVEQRTGLPLPGLSRQPSAGRAPGAGDRG